MKILHTVRQYRPSKGGLENYTESLAQHQAALGHEVTVLTLDKIFGNDRLSLPDEEVIGGVRVIRVPFIGNRVLFFPFVSPSCYRDYDIIHAHGFDQLTDVTGGCRLFNRKKFFITTHGLFFHTENLKRVKEIYLRTISRFTAGGAEKIYAVGGNDHAVLKKAGVESEIVYNPVIPFTNMTAAGEDFLCLGRISDNKRIDLAIRFLAEYIRQSGAQSPKLHIVGEDNEGLTERLINTAEKENISDRVIFHGFLEKEALEKILPLCGYGLSASRYEGYGLATVEGMSAGLIPVLHDNPAFREIHTRSGCGFIGDFNRLKPCVAAFITARDNLSPGIREKARRFALTESYATLAENTVKDYQKALDAENKMRVNAEGTEIRHIAALPVRVFTEESAVAKLANAVKTGEKLRVCFGNTNLAVKLNELGAAERDRILNKFNIVLNDGLGMDLASKYLYGASFPDNLNGTDFAPAFFRALPPGTRFYFYGSDQETVIKAVRVIEAEYHLKCVGFHDGFTPPPADFITRINQARPDIILAAKGNPLQEIWIADHAETLNAPVIIGVGALADFLTGKFKRAPKFIRHIRCEWLYRLLQEPNRLKKRYTKDIHSFFQKVRRNV